MLLAGSAVAHLDGETVALRSMDALRVSPSFARHFEAGPEGADLLAIGAPAAARTTPRFVQLDTTA